MFMKLWIRTDTFPRQATGPSELIKTSGRTGPDDRTGLWHLEAEPTCPEPGDAHGSGQNKTDWTVNSERFLLAEIHGVPEDPPQLLVVLWWKPAFPVEVLVLRADRHHDNMSLKNVSG